MRELSREELIVLKTIARLDAKLSVSTLVRALAVRQTNIGDANLVCELMRKELVKWECLERTEGKVYKVTAAGWKLLDALGIGE